MSLEAYKVTYEGRENESFKDALLDHLIAPAYERAKSYSILSEDPQIIDMRMARQYEADGPFVAYTVYAAKDEPRLDIRAAVYASPTDMTYEEAQGMLAEIASNHDLNVEVKERLASYTPNEFIDTADVDYIMGASYQVDLVGRTIEIATELGYRVDGAYVLASGSNNGAGRRQANGIWLRRGS